MANNVIITIGRQFGSGGHEIGNKLANKLDIPLYDRNLVKMAAEELKISDSAVESVDEIGLNRFLTYYASAPVDYTSYYLENEDLGQPLSQQVYFAQAKLIKKLADRSSCVMVGRCADYILADEPGLLNIFITADKEERIARIAKKYGISDKKAADKIKKVDRERRYYYEFHTGEDWGSTEAHQMILNSSTLGIDRTVDILAAIYKELDQKLNQK